MSSDITAAEFAAAVNAAVDADVSGGGDSGRGVRRVIVQAPPGPPPDTDSPEWEEVGVLHKLTLYPIKSCMGVQLKEAQVTREYLTNGSFLRDRQFVVMEVIRDGSVGGSNDKLRMWSAGSHPALVLIELAEVDNKDGVPARVRLSAPGMEDATITLDDATPTRKIDIWGELCAGVDAGDAASAWLGEFLLGPESARELRLLWHRDAASSRIEHRRRHDGSDGHFPAISKGDIPLYADFIPYSLMSAETIAEVGREVREANPDLDDRIVFDERRFRNNFVIKGVSKAFDEDEYAFVRIGEEVVLRTALQIPRCNVTAVDPDVGEATPGGEPLKTLMKFRTALDANERRGFFVLPVLGLMMAQQRGGTVREGDKVFAIRRSDLVD